MSAQFLSSFADNALLIVAIKLLSEMEAPTWMEPTLRSMFVISYVLLAAFVAAFADSRPKGQVMFVTNIIKVVGLSLMLFTIHPLMAYAVVGLGAAAYSPAKYGILTELLPANQLVVANAWIEGTTVGSIILGFAVGGWLYSPNMGAFLMSLHLPGAHTAAQAALWVILIFYLAASICNLQIPDTGARYAPPRWDFISMAKSFSRSVYVLWHDKLGQISLAMTTLVWAAAATLQLIVLRWAQEVLGLPDHKAPMLLGVVAIGVAIGAIAAARLIPLKKALSVSPLGVLMGAACIVLAFYSKTWFPDDAYIGRMPLSIVVAMLFLVVVGGLAGFFIVPMNALLQHRGYVRLSAGHSIAVQNFTENIGIVVMLGFYALLLGMGLTIKTIIIIFGILMMILISLVMLWNRMNMKERDWTQLIGEEKDPGLHK